VGANLGMTCKVSNLECSANIANAIIIKSVKNASSNFYMEFIRSDYGQTQIMSEAAGGAQGVFNTKLAQGLVVPVPPLDEQVLIGSNLIAVDQNINLAEDKFSRFILIKKALMQDLLTGKVRVKIDDKESAVA
jgi:type I restriction enzyme S subunit